MKDIKTKYFKETIEQYKVLREKYKTLNNFLKDTYIDHKYSEECGDIIKGFVDLDRTIEELENSAISQISFANFKKVDTCLENIAINLDNGMKIIYNKNHDMNATVEYESEEIPQNIIDGKDEKTEQNEQEEKRLIKDFKAAAEMALRDKEKFREIIEKIKDAMSKDLENQKNDDIIKNPEIIQNEAPQMRPKMKLL